MGIFDSFKEKLSEVHAIMSKTDLEREKEVELRVQKAAAHVNRAHARQELKRYQGEIDKCDQIISSAEASFEAKETAREQKEYYMEALEGPRAEVAKYTEEIEKCEAKGKDYAKEVAARRALQYENFKAEVKDDFAVVVANTKEVTEQTKQSVLDSIYTIPQKINEFRDKVIDNAVATLSAATDFLAEKNEQAKVQGLAAYNNLGEFGRAFARAGIRLDRADAIKTYEGIAKIDNALEKVASWTEQKKQDLKEVGEATQSLGRSLGKLFGIKPKEKAEPEKEAAEEKKPGWVLSFVKEQKAKAYDRVVELYEKELDSLDRSRELAFEVREDASRVKLNKLEHVMRDAEKDLAEKAFDTQDRLNDFIDRSER